MKLEAVLLLDTETTDLEVENGEVIEVGAVLFSMDHMSVIECYSALIESDAPNPVEKINHIPEAAYAEWGMGPYTVWKRVDQMGIDCQAVLAHNADFDRKWVEGKPGIGKGGGMTILDLPWIDTCGGVQWPLESRPGSSLVNLAFEHGLGVDDPHRALSDCLLLARLLRQCHRLGYDVQKILERGLRPTATYESLEPYANRKIVKDAGFKWKPIIGRSKESWVRKMAIEDAKCLGFRVREIDPSLVKW